MFFFQNGRVWQGFPGALFRQSFDQSSRFGMRMRMTIVEKQIAVASPARSKTETKNQVFWEKTHFRHRPQWNSSLRIRSEQNNFICHEMTIFDGLRNITFNAGLKWMASESKYFNIKVLVSFSWHSWLISPLTFWTSKNHWIAESASWWACLNGINSWSKTNTIPEQILQDRSD
jgi:hypothetical protein